MAGLTRFRARAGIAGVPLAGSLVRPRKEVTQKFDTVQFVHPEVRATGSQRTFTLCR